jgi:hypothetical protein
MHHASTWAAMFRSWAAATRAVSRSRSRSRGSAGSGRSLRARGVGMAARRAGAPGEERRSGGKGNGASEEARRTAARVDVAVHEEHDQPSLSQRREQRAETVPGRAHGDSRALLELAHRPVEEPVPLGSGDDVDAESESREREPRKLPVAEMAPGDHGAPSRRGRAIQQLHPLEPEILVPGVAREAPLREELGEMAMVVAEHRAGAAFAVGEAPESGMPRPADLAEIREHGPPARPIQAIFGRGDPVGDGPADGAWDSIGHAERSLEQEACEHGRFS